MKTINRAQYFLFAIILLGMFASFAQNEYSTYLLNYPFLFIGILFFIEMFLTIRELNTKQPATQLAFFEYLALGLFFCGVFFLNMHWAGADPMLLSGVIILLILYSGYGITIISKYFNYDKVPSLILFSLALITCLAMVASIFKVQNWPGAGEVIGLSCVLSFIFLLLILINPKFQDRNGNIGVRDCLRKINSKLVLSYVFFSFWTIYFALISVGIAPRLYSLANPPALEKMYQEHNPKADIYWKYFQNFLDNRKAKSNKTYIGLSKSRKDSLEISTNKK